MRKWVNGLLMVMLSIFLVSSGFAKAPVRKIITFWDENAGPNRTPYFEELIKRFEQKNPDIKVEYVGLPWSNAKQKFDVAIAAQELPDCSGVPTLFLADFLNKNALLELDKYFNGWDEKTKINTLEIEANRNLAKNRKLYMIPNTTNINVLWLRPDVLALHGLKAPQTWDDFYAMVKKTTDKSKNIYGFSLRGGASSAYELEILLYAYSGITSYFTKDGKATINDPRNIEALKRFVSIYKVHTQESDITNGYKEMVAAFDSGRAAAIMHNLGSYGEHMQTLGAGKFIAAPYPKALTGKWVIRGGRGSGYGVYRTSKNPEAAWKFISYLCSAEGQSFWNRSIGQLPTNSDVFKEEWVKNYDHIVMAGKVLADKNSVLIMPPTYLPEYPAIQKQLGEPGFQEVLLGRKSPEQFLNEWASALENAKASFDKRNKN